MGNLLAAQSGGPTTAINATLRGILEEAMVCGRYDRVYGGLYGIKGILEEQLVELSDVFLSPMDLDLLSRTPSSALGSCRYKLGDIKTDETVYAKLVSIFRKYDITGFIYIGGNDSMDTVNKLSRYLEQRGITDICAAGAPKTVDNDLTETDHCPGFGSAAKYIATTFSQLERDLAVYDTFGVTIVEIMGRNSGWLTAASALARQNGDRGPDFIYLCEKPFSVERFLEDIRSRQSERRGILIAVSEGVRDEDGKYVTEIRKDSRTDVFGHRDIAGTGKVLEEIVRQEIGCKVRSIELNLMQRCASQAASSTDLLESRLLGAMAVQCILQEKNGHMAVVKRVKNHPYRVAYTSVPVSLVANKEKTVPLEWINEQGNDIEQPLMDYLQPLIAGEVPLSLSNGLPVYFKIGAVSRVDGNVGNAL